jgi:hypothetical protein
MIVESFEDVIKISGDLTTNQWETIRTAASLLMKKHPSGVIVDCSDLRKCTEEGAETFYDMMRYIQSHRARIIVANVPEHCLPVLQRVPEVRSNLPIAHSVEEARRSLELLDQLAFDKKRAPVTTGKLLLILTGSSSDHGAMALASLLAEKRQLSVVAVYTLLVPRALVTSAPMPEEEEEAARVLQKTQEVLSAKSIPVELEMERARSVVSAVEATRQRVAPRVVVLSVPDEDPAKNEPISTLQQILQTVSAELIFVRASKETKTSP